MRRSQLVLVAGLLATAAAGCGGSSGGDAPKGADTSPSAAAAITVTSSIADGAVLTNAVTWEAKPAASDTDPISKVEFSVDGNVRWTEENEPYVFNEDGQVLAPWLLGNGAHVLSVHALTLGGAEGTATSNVTVRVDTSANAALAGTYKRTVTSSDQSRVQPYRTADKGAFGEVPPPGKWTLKVLAAGQLEGADPNEPDAPFVQPFTVTGNQLHVYGPAIWRQANPSKPNIFCEPERPSDYTWRRSGSTLTLAPMQKVCADRDIVLVGTWTKTG